MHMYMYAFCWYLMLEFWLIVCKSKSKFNSNLIMLIIAKKLISLCLSQIVDHNNNKINFILLSKLLFARSHSILISFEVI